MKKSIFYLALISLSAGSIFTSCDSKKDKTEDVQEAKEDLAEAQRELNAEYPTFKTEMEVRIADNEMRIAELRVVLDKPGKLPLDEVRKTRIDDLEKQNALLRTRLYDYEKERSDWESFKTEFKHDMDGIGNAFADLGKDNKK